jgi:hypothetical protein
VEVGEACGRIPLPIKRYGGHKGCVTTIRNSMRSSDTACYFVEKVQVYGMSEKMMSEGNERTWNGVTFSTFLRSCENP